MSVAVDAPRSVRIAWSTTGSNPAVFHVGGIVDLSGPSHQYVHVSGRCSNLKLTREFIDYVRAEARRRNVSAMEVFEEELAANEMVNQLLPSNEMLEELARLPVRSEYLIGEEECPF